MGIDFHRARARAILDGYPASSATPAATKLAAIHRRRSTRSCKKIFAATAFAINVREAAAGATRLTSPQESANNRLKKAAAMLATAKKKLGLLSVRAITLARPTRRRRAPTSPTCFMACDRSTSPTTEAKTMATIALQV